MAAMLLYPAGGPGALERLVAVFRVAGALSARGLDAPLVEQLCLLERPRRVVVVLPGPCPRWAAAAAHAGCGVVCSGRGSR